MEPALRATPMKALDLEFLSPSLGLRYLPCLVKLLKHGGLGPSAPNARTEVHPPDPRYSRFLLADAHPSDSNKRSTLWPLPALPGATGSLDSFRVGWPWASWSQETLPWPGRLPCLRLSTFCFVCQRNGCGSKLPRRDYAGFGPCFTYQGSILGGFSEPQPNARFGLCLRERDSLCP